MDKPTVTAEWATTPDTNNIYNNPNRIAPTTQMVVNGFGVASVLDRNTLNFLFWNYGQWIQYLASLNQQQAKYTSEEAIKLLDNPKSAIKGKIYSFADKEDVLRLMHTDGMKWFEIKTESCDLSNFKND